MNLSIIGSGYVGLSAGVSFASLGHEVTLIDNDITKVEQLKKGIPTIYEEGLTELLHTHKDRLNFTNDITEVNESEIIFICVGTPSNDDGSTNTSFLQSVAKELGEVLQRDILVVNKSTAPIGTTLKIQSTINEVLMKRNQCFRVNVCVNPEFLREGFALHDFLHPNRIVIGSEDVQKIQELKNLYQSFNAPLLVMDTKSAELSKYASNAFLATKISFINEISFLSSKIGANILEISLVMGLDSRIGREFLHAGIGYGGSCFPKDLASLSYMYEELGLETRLINAARQVNEDAWQNFTNEIRRELNGFTGLKIAIWGISFKPGTDDIRESPALKIAKTLMDEGARVMAYDPKVKSLPDSYAGITLGNDKEEILLDAHALLLLVEWEEFKEPSFSQIYRSLSHPNIFDARNIWMDIKLYELGFNYICVGRKPQIHKDRECNELT